MKATEGSVRAAAGAWLGVDGALSEMLSIDSPATTVAVSTYGEWSSDVNRSSSRNKKLPMHKMKSKPAEIAPTQGSS